MEEELSSDIIVDVIEATINVLIGTGLTRDDALQVMLSQIAAQVSPDVMKIAAQLNEKYYQDFEKAMWCVDEVKTDEPVKSAEFAFGPLKVHQSVNPNRSGRFLLDRFSDLTLSGY